MEILLSRIISNTGMFPKLYCLVLDHKSAESISPSGVVSITPNKRSESKSSSVQSLWTPDHALFEHENKCHCSFLTLNKNYKNVKSKLVLIFFDKCFRPE